MAGFPMVQPTPFSPRKPSLNRDFYHCKYCKELRMAQSVQPSADKRNALMLSPLIISFVPMSYYIVTGSEKALAVWLLCVVFGMVI
jgi:hypothetical protein